jgi:DNA primase
MPKYAAWARRHLDIRSENGEQFYGRCPFTENHPHGDRNPSFSFHVRKGVFYCLSCHETGTAKQLADKLKVRLTEGTPRLSDIDRKLRELNANVEQVKVYPDAWLEQFAHSKVVKEYWCSERGLSPDTVDEFRLGYDRRSDAATVPIRDLSGRCLGVIRRRLGINARPRYLYPKGFKITEHLWGAYAAKAEPKIAVVEGSVDALALWDVGIPAVALLGSRISTHQAHLLRKLSAKELVLMLDRDAAGRKAAAQVREATSGLLVSIGTYRKAWKAKDPAELSGPQRWQMFDNAVPIPLSRKLV